MVTKINEAISNKISSLLPNIEIYDEKVPQDFVTPSFFISTYDQSYDEGISRNKSTINYDVSYFPKDEISKNNEMYGVQILLLRGLRDLGLFRAINLRSNITDDVLHIMFDVKYSEYAAVNEVKMNKLVTDTNIKEE